MQVKELIQNHSISELEIVRHRCSQFIVESDGHSILKNLPKTYENFQKVKVRKRKQSNTFSHTFNVAFNDEIQDLRERAVFVNGMVNIQESHDPFYIFPVDGYQYLYSREVENSTENYRQVFESIFENLGEESAKDTFTDLLRFSYMSENLVEGIDSGAEIILYGIPCYYAIRHSCVESYDSLLTSLV